MTARIATRKSPNIRISATTAARARIPLPAPRPSQKRLMRSSTDCKMGGVCGGIAEYLDVDSTIVRLIWVILIFSPVPIFPAFVGYFVGWLVMPQAPLPAPAAPQPAAPSSSSPHPAPTA